MSTHLSHKSGVVCQWTSRAEEAGQILNKHQLARGQWIEKKPEVKLRRVTGLALIHSMHPRPVLHLVLLFINTKQA